MFEPETATEWSCKTRIVIILSFLINFSLFILALSSPNSATELNGRLSTASLPLWKFRNGLFISVRFPLQALIYRPPLAVWGVRDQEVPSM